MATATLLIVDDNRLFREGVKRILSNKRFTIQNEVNSFVEALSLMQNEKIRFNLVVGNPVADQQCEFDAMETIIRDFSDVKVVILTDREATPRSDMALRNGVVGFLSKDISGEALRHSLELVLMGEQVIPIVVQRIRSTLPATPIASLAEIAKDARPEAQSAATETPAEAALPAAEAKLDPNTLVGLSGREDQILKCLVNGLSNKLIARELNMAEATVKVHLRALLRKLKAQNRTQAAIWAMKNAPTQIRTKRHDIHHVAAQATVKYEGQERRRPLMQERRRSLLNGLKNELAARNSAIG